MADLTILGDAKTISSMTSQMGLNLAGANIVSPAASPNYEDYVSTFLEMRKKKGMSRELAQDSSIAIPEEKSTEPAPEPVEEKMSLPANINEILPLFLATINGLTTLSANRIHWLLRESNDSLAAFYERISDPNCIKVMTWS